MCTCLLVCMCACAFTWVYLYYTVRKCICIYDICVCAFESMFACSPLSGAEGSCGLIVRHTLGCDAFSVVVIHHLVRDFCQNTLSQCSWGGLEAQREEERGRETSLKHASLSHAWFQDAKIYSWARCCQRSEWVRLMRSDRLIWQPQNIPAFTFFTYHSLVSMCSQNGTWKNTLENNFQKQ